MMKVRTAAIAMAFALLGAGVAAQENPNDFHARHNADSVYNVDRAQHASTQQPPRPTGYWEKTWGAIATSRSGGALGTAVGAPSESDAKRLALADCKAKGGGGCSVDIAYRNQCAAMVVGIQKVDKEMVALNSAASVEEASLDALNVCRSKSDTKNCKVYYSACTEPIYRRH